MIESLEGKSAEYLLPYVQGGLLYLLFGDPEDRERAGQDFLFRQTIKESTEDCPYALYDPETKLYRWGGLYNFDDPGTSGGTLAKPPSHVRRDRIFTVPPFDPSLTIVRNRLSEALQALRATLAGPDNDPAQEVLRGLDQCLESASRTWRNVLAREIFYAAFDGKLSKKSIAERLASKTASLQEEYHARNADGASVSGALALTFLAIEAGTSSGDRLLQSLLRGIHVPLASDEDVLLRPVAAAIMREWLGEGDIGPLTRVGSKLFDLADSVWERARVSSSTQEYLCRCGDAYTAFHAGAMIFNICKARNTDAENPWYQRGHHVDEMAVRIVDVMTYHLDPFRAREPLERTVGQLRLSREKGGQRGLKRALNRYIDYYCLWPCSAREQLIKLVDAG